MINTRKPDLYDKLKQGPSFLFLGQKYLEIETGIDPFLAEIVRKYGHGKSSGGYNRILDNETTVSIQSIESALAWMQNKCKTFSVPVWLETVGSVGWNGVYTSAIDTIWMRAFSSSWRELEPIYTEEKDPIDARSRSRLHCTHLFGSVDQTSLDRRSPLKRVDLNKRRQVAIALARRLPRLVTPFGVLVIEGYSINEDWLQIDDFAGILDEFSSGQVYMFHSSKDIMNNPNIEYLVNQEKLILYSQSLASFLKQGEDFVQLAEEHRDEAYGHRVNVASRAVSVPLSLRNQVSRSAIIIDESTFSAFSVLSDDSLYSEFRNFLARSSERPVWSGYPRGFAFQRDFEKELEEKVKSSLTQKQLEEEPIILHGQSGIGKTIALASLIFKMQQQFKQYPILFIERRPIKPNYHDIAAFVTWAEQQGAPASLIVWDGMLNYDQYLDLVLYLTGDGQKITLVGSSYRQHKGHTTKLKAGKRSMPHDSHWVEAEAILTSQEKMRFEKWITQFVPNISGIKPLLDQYGANFFVALYRLLPSSRSKLMEGINLETIYTEEQIKQIAEEIVTSQGNEVFTSPLAYALLNAGLVDSMSVFSTDKSEIAGEFLDQVQRLIGLIMVPGRFGLRTPIDLLLRALRNETQVDLVDLLEKVDLFTWSTDEIGNISVGPRHALEAELVAKIRLGGPQYEIDFISHLVKNIIVNDMEIQFVLDLIRKINPPDEDPTWNPYGPYLLRLADALAYLREQRSIFNPRLMLQETNLLREAAKILSDNTELTPQNLLERAENVVNNALDFADRENSSNQDLRSQLLVELAATLGAKAKQLYSLDANIATQLYFYLKQRLFEAQAASRDNFYPLDVFFWTTQDLIKASAVDLTIKLDAQAEIYNVFEMAQLEETFANQERFQERRQQLGQLLQNEKMSNAAFLELERQGSTAGYVLRAIQIGGEVPRDRIPSDSELKKAHDATLFLEGSRKKIKADGRAMQLLLRYWWLSKSKRVIFWDERQSVPFDSNDWKYCLEILTNILQTEEVYRAPIVKYLLAVTFFHLNMFDNADTLFNELRRDPPIRGRRRILRSYLMSNPDGTPRKFAGTVEWVDAKKNRGEIYIPDIRRKILFIPSDFRRPDIMRGSALNDFHIAFNFLGVIADHPNYLEYSGGGRRS